MSKEVVYLDYAAATPLSKKVLEAMRPYLHEMYFNASAPYLAAKGVAKDLAAARAAVARTLGCRPAEIIFTAGGTEANNLAIQGVMQAFPEGNTVISAIEHESVLAPAHRYDHEEAAVKPDGIVDIEDLRRRIDDKTVLVSIMYANNEIGTVQPLAEISNTIKEIRLERAKNGNTLPLYFHTDAAQAGNYLHLLVDKLGVDLMTLNGGKLYGPKQTGALYVKAGTVLQPQILGGRQEWNLRSGTENVANSIGFAAALSMAQEMREDEAKRLSALKDAFINLLETQMPNIVLTTNHEHSLPNNIHFRVPGQDNERLMMALDEAGIMCAVGSACSASSDEPSHVLSAIGLSDEEARSSLRFTMGRDTTEQDVKHAVDALRKLIV